MVYTSYYGISKRFPRESLVSISLWIPKSIQISQYKALAPTEAILKNWKADHSIENYVAAYYRDVLDKLDAGKIYQELNHKILLCYEKHKEFCHRHIVAAWLESAGYPCREIC